MLTVFWLISTVITPFRAVLSSSKPSWADQVEEEGDEGEKLIQLIKSHFFTLHLTDVYVKISYVILAAIKTLCDCVVTGY